MATATPTVPVTTTEYWHPPADVCEVEFQENIPQLSDNLPVRNIVVDKVNRLNASILVQETYFIGEDKRIWNNTRALNLFSREELTGKTFLELIQASFAQNLPYLIAYGVHCSGSKNLKFKFYDAVAWLQDRAKGEEKRAIKATEGEEILVLHTTQFRRDDIFEVLGRTPPYQKSIQVLPAEFLIEANCRNSWAQVEAAYRFHKNLGIRKDERNFALAIYYGMMAAGQGCVVGKRFIKQFYPEAIKDQTLPTLKASENWPETEPVGTFRKLYFALCNLIEELRIDIEPKVVGVKLSCPEVVSEVSEFGAYTYWTLSCNVDNGRGVHPVSRHIKLHIPNEHGWSSNEKFKVGDRVFRNIVRLLAGAIQFIPLIAALDPSFPTYNEVNTDVFRYLFEHMNSERQFADNWMRFKTLEKQFRALQSFTITLGPLSPNLNQVKMFTVDAKELYQRFEIIGAEGHPLFSKKTEGNESNKESCIVA